MKVTQAITFIVLGFIIFGAVALFATTLTHAIVNSPDNTEIPHPEYDAQYQKIASTASSSLPERLQIPSIGVDAAIQHVGLAKSGHIAVPTNYSDVAWYKYGAIPGHVGTAVIDGHYDNGFGRDAVLKRLAELKPGDEVIVVDQQNRKLYFKVYDTGTLDATTTDTSNLFASNGKALLNIITCEGQWIPEQKMYTERRVVYTEFERAE